MATTKANLMQTAFNVGANITAAQVQAGILADAEAIKTALFTTADEVFAKLDAERTPADEAKTGGRTGGGSSKEPTVEESLDTALKFGAFKGLTLRKVLGMKASETEEYNYTSGNGKKYIEWLAGSKDEKLRFMQKRAAIVLESLRAGSAEE